MCIRDRLWAYSLFPSVIGARYGHILSSGRTEFSSASVAHEEGLDGQFYSVRVEPYRRVSCV
eukprot:9456136-Pyramimonas_sp.AAC.3